MPTTATERNPERLQRHLAEVERLTLNQRIQHGLVALFTLVLMLSGLPLRYYRVPLVGWLLRAMGGISGQTVIHRGAAVGLMGLCAYHLCYLLFSSRGYRDFRELLPGLKDGRDLLQMLRYYFGLSRERARFGRFSYIEKFEYLAVAWGSLVMAGTGLVLWFQTAAMLVLPKWMLDVARVVHSWEALLAFLAIIIWHFYNAHFNPACFPISWVWWHGRISEEQLRHEHPLEFERLMASPREREEA